MSTPRHPPLPPLPATYELITSVAYLFDHAWQVLEGPWDRLRWARLRWQRKVGAIRPTATHAATALGLVAVTYRTYERPPGSVQAHRAYDHQLAIRFGRRFKVSWPWLLTGEGSPFDSRTSAQERVMRVMALLDEQQQEALAAMAEAFASVRQG
jgi:hypothetical protein